MLHESICLALMREVLRRPESPLARAYATLGGDRFVEVAAASVITRTQEYPHNPNQPHAAKSAESEVLASVIVDVLAESCLKGTTP